VLLLQSTFTERHTKQPARKQCRSADSSQIIQERASKAWLTPYSYTAVPFCNALACSRYDPRL
jgi:hypothetical protein